MAKRTNGEGTIRHRKDGRWEAAIMDGFRKDGKPNMKHFYGKTQKEVKEKLKAWEKDRESGLNLRQEMTFLEWSNVWFENHKSNIQPTTQENYKYTLRILQDHFDRQKIKEIKAYDVEVFLKKLRKDGRSDSYLASCRAMLYQIFNKAEANDLILKNPVRFAEKMRSSGPIKRKEAFTTEEVQCLMRELSTDRIGISIRLMLGTGMRTQELLALEPRHISEDGATIEIEQAVNMVKGTAVVGTPKSRDSYRVIPVPPVLQKYAIALRDTKQKYVWEAGKKNSPCNPSYFRKQFKTALAQIPEVRELTPHSCRHTYVSQMQALGVDLATIQSIVGHADTDMTQHYLHVQKSIQQTAVNRYSELLSVE